MDKKHDYRDTIEEAKDLKERHDLGRKKREAEIAYEALAAATSTGLFGSERNFIELTELELAKQLDYHFMQAESEYENE